MPEPIEQELATLRQTVAELTQKNATRKARITELENALTISQTATQTAQAELTRIQITEPMMTLASSLSATPELFLSEMQRIGYSAEMQDGKITLMRDGKPVEDADITADGIKTLLLSDDPAHKNMPHLIIANRASGGNAIGSERSTFTQAAQSSDKPVRAKTHFGLR